MQKQTGKFIVIDGTDGSGKATQTNILVEKLRAKGLEVEKLDFPRYGEKSAGLVEEYLNGKFGTAEEVGAYRASIFYAVDRFAAANQIKEWLNQGKIIISNRYVSSNMGHQAGKIQEPIERDKFLAWLHHLEYELFEIPQPDINVLLYMPPHIGQKLVDQKGHRDYVGGEKRDIHEADLNHLRDAAEAYKYVADKYSWDIIDCAPGDKLRTIDDISLDLWRLAASHLNLGTPTPNTPLSSDIRPTKNQTGVLEVVCGSMFAGKTEELLRRLKRSVIAKKSVKLFKPSLDTRFSETHVVSHDNNQMESIIINKAEDILKHLDHNTDVIGIDEAQFFDDKLPQICDDLANLGFKVIVAGLDTTFDSRPFGPMPELLSLAEKVTKLRAICSDCGADAVRNLRKSNTQETIGIGGKDEYKPLCRKCFNQNR